MSTNKYNMLVMAKDRAIKEQEKAELLLGKIHENLAANARHETALAKRLEAGTIDPERARVLKEEMADLAKELRKSLLTAYTMRDKTRLAAHDAVQELIEHVKGKKFDDVYAAKDKALDMAEKAWTYMKRLEAAEKYNALKMAEALGMEDGAMRDAHIKVASTKGNELKAIRLFMTAYMRRVGSKVDAALKEENDMRNMLITMRSAKIKVEQTKNVEVAKPKVEQPKEEGLLAMFKRKLGIGLKDKSDIKGKSDTPEIAEIRSQLTQHLKGSRDKRTLR